MESGARFDVHSIRRNGKSMREKGFEWVGEKEWFGRGEGFGVFYSGQASEVSGTNLNMFKEFGGAYKGLNPLVFGVIELGTVGFEGFYFCVECVGDVDKETGHFLGCCVIEAAESALRLIGLFGNVEGFEVAIEVAVFDEFAGFLVVGVAVEGVEVHPDAGFPFAELADEGVAVLGVVFDEGVA